MTITIKKIKQAIYKYGSRAEFAEEVFDSEYGPVLTGLETDFGQIQIVPREDIVLRFGHDSQVAAIYFNEHDYYVGLEIFADSYDSYTDYGSYSDVVFYNLKNEVKRVLSLSKEQEREDEEPDKVKFWELVNAYVTECGGNPSQNMSHKRMELVVEIERILNEKL